MRSHASGLETPIPKCSSPRWRILGSPVSDVSNTTLFFICNGKTARLHRLEGAAHCGTTTTHASKLTSETQLTAAKRKVRYVNETSEIPVTESNSGQRMGVHWKKCNLMVYSEVKLLQRLRLTAPCFINLAALCQMAGKMLPAFCETNNFARLQGSTC